MFPIIVTVNSRRFDIKYKVYISWVNARIQMVFLGCRLICVGQQSFPLFVFSSFRLFLFSLSPLLLFAHSPLLLFPSSPHLLYFLYTFLDKNKLNIYKKVTKSWCCDKVTNQSKATQIFPNWLLAVWKICVDLDWFVITCHISYRVTFIMRLSIYFLIS